MKEAPKGLHPEVVKNWNIQSDYKDPMEFLKKVYLIKNPPNWAAKELAPKKNECQE